MSSMLWIRNLPVCSTQSSMNGSRKACSASASERYAPSTMRQYSRTFLTIECESTLGCKHYRQGCPDCATLTSLFPRSQALISHLSPDLLHFYPATNGFEILCK